MCTADCQPCVIGNNFEFWKLMKNLKAVSGSLTDIYDQYLRSTLINKCLLVEPLHKILDMVSKMPDLRPNLRRKKCKKRKFFIVKFFFDITLRNIRNLPNFLPSF